jgi:hypothetical protein
MMMAIRQRISQMMADVTPLPMTVKTILMLIVMTVWITTATPS